MTAGPTHAAAAVGLGPGACPCGVLMRKGSRLFRASFESLDLLRQQSPTTTLADLPSGIGAGVDMTRGPSIVDPRRPQDRALRRSERPTMLRTLFLLFVLANVLVLAWRSTWLSPWLPVPSERKPEILAQLHMRTACAGLATPRLRPAGPPRQPSSGCIPQASSGESSGASAASGLAPSGSTPAAPPPAP